MEERIKNIVNFLKPSFDKYKPEVAVILGSGLGYLVNELQEKKVIPTQKIPGYPVSTVEGHSGNWVFGYYYEKPVLFLQGRVHYYEGYGIQEVVLGIKAMAKNGIKKLLVTNSAGGLNPKFKAGDLMIIMDQINMMCKNPLTGPNDTSGPRFPDMSAPYNQEYIDILQNIAIQSNITVQKGVFVGMTGPNYETQAEVKFLQQIGGDAVGMSTVPEVVVAVQTGLKVAGISCISNMATGLSGTALSHQEVTQTANQIKFTFGRLVGQFVLEI